MDLGEDTSCTMFAIFDGHGGKVVADHAAQLMPEIIKKELRN